MRRRGSDMAWWPLDPVELEKPLVYIHWWKLWLVGLRTWTCLWSEPIKSFMQLFFNTSCAVNIASRLTDYITLSPPFLSQHVVILTKRCAWIPKPSQHLRCLGDWTWPQMIGLMVYFLHFGGRLWRQRKVKNIWFTWNAAPDFFAFI